MVVAVNAEWVRPKRSNIYSITSSRRSCSKSISISGGSCRALLIKRENNKSTSLGLTLVIPR